MGGIAERSVDDAGDSTALYVGGFLAVYGERADEEELDLPREIIEAKLIQRADRCAGIPVNVNHAEDSVVGSVLGLFDLADGLFCVAKIYSPTFLDIASRAASKSQLVARGPGNGLKPDPVVEYLSTLYPGLSLSSRVPGPETIPVKAALSPDSGRLGGDAQSGPDDRFFEHVAICGVGRRRGTLGIYGRDLPWILDRFSFITPEERDNVLRHCAERASALPSDISDPFGSDAVGLLANSVDIGYIRQRFDKLRYDKKMLRRDGDTYVKASESPALTAPPCNIKVPDGANHGAAIAASGCMAQPVSSASALGAPGVPASSAIALPSDGVYLSKEALFSLLNVARTPVGVPSSAQSAVPYVASTVPYAVPTGATPIGAAYQHPTTPPPFFQTAAVPHSRSGMYGYERAPVVESAPGQFQGFRDDCARGLVYDRVPEASERYHRARDPDFDESRARETRGRRQLETRLERRRRRVADDGDESDEDVRLPGDSGYRRREKRRRGREDAPDGDDVMETVGYGELRDAINDLKRDLASMRASRDAVPRARSEGPGNVPVPALTVPEATATSTLTGDSTGEVHPAIERDCPVTPPKGAETVGKRRADGTRNGTVNASCEPDGLPATPHRQSVADLNRKLFVAALDRLES